MVHAFIVGMVPMVIVGFVRQVTEMYLHVILIGDKMKKCSIKKRKRKHKLFQSFCLCRLDKTVANKKSRQILWDESA